MRPAVTALLLLALAACDSTGIELQGPRDVWTEPDVWDAPVDTSDPDIAWWEDEDGDTISDPDEGRHIGADTDSDGVPDYLDDDSDGDTIPDSTEAGDMDLSTPPVDSDRDGVPDFVDLDSDGNGMLDVDEGTVDTDADGVADYADPDNDGDTIDDEVEIQGNPADPPDTDGDGRPDHVDVDSDGDTISDRHERDMDTDDDRVPDYLDLDADGDTIPDSTEAGDMDISTAPRDTDGDYIPDFRDYDSDADGLSDWWEFANGLNPYDADTDADGCPDIIEVEAGTDPLDGSDDPRTHGMLYFIVPYNDPGDPPDPPVEPEPTLDHLAYTRVGAATSITTELADDPSDRVDAPHEFIEHVEPNTEGGMHDPAHPERVCLGGLEVVDAHDPLDGRPDSFVSVGSGTTVCFDVVPRRNETVPASDEVTLYKAWIHIKGDGGSLLGTRNLYFLVPPDWSWLGP